MSPCCYCPLSPVRWFGSIFFSFQICSIYFYSDCIRVIVQSFPLVFTLVGIYAELTNQPYKNLLQEFLQKSNLPLPVYNTVNEGLQHAPKFRSTVCVNGVEITSQKTFWTRKEAEKFVAALGYKSIVENKIEEVPRNDSPLPQEVYSFFINVI